MLKKLKILSVMNTIRVEKNKNYTVISNTVLKDTNLSLKAKGLMCVILSLPDNWDFTINGLLAIVKESKNTIYTIINELEQGGYVQKERITDKKGRFMKIEYVFHESPLHKNPDVDNPHVDNPHVDKCTQLSTNNNKVLNKINTKTLSQQKISTKKIEPLKEKEYTPPQVAVHPPPTKDEVYEYFYGKVPINSQTPERFFNIMTAQNWTYRGSKLYDWKLIADNWIVNEKKEVTHNKIAKQYESINKDEQRATRIARHLQRYNASINKRTTNDGDY